MVIGLSAYVISCDPVGEGSDLSHQFPSQSRRLTSPLGLPENCAVETENMASGVKLSEPPPELPYLRTLGTLWQRGRAKRYKQNG
jgi:hypothetical protein